MPRSRIGPLLLESPLGGRGSQVYRAIHAEQKLQLAVRVISVPMGMTPEAKQAFAKEIEELKKLRHPNIVRCFGGGFDQRDAYLVYEVIDGESLADILQHRQRLPWQLVLHYGLQISSALQHAHTSGWIHARLRPDKLLCRKDSETILVSDFRRDGEMAAMMSSRLLLDQMVYRAPETFSQTFDASSDLYSLGAILYHALTGHPLFTATTQAELKSQIANVTVPSVSTENFECPVWLSKIVQQLLEKDPSLRPYSAAAVNMALQEAQRREEQRIGVAQHVVSGFSPLQLQIDRTEAEKALGRRKKKPRSSSVRSESSVSLMERPWFILTCLALLVAATVFFMLPPSEAKLRKQAETAVASSEFTELLDAKDRYLLPILERFPDGEHSSWAREQVDRIDMLGAERRMERNARFHREPSSEGERKFLEALRFERFGDRITALRKYHAIVKLLEDVEPERPFVLLAKRQISQLESEPWTAEELRTFLAAKIEAAQQMAHHNPEEATEILNSIVQLYQSDAECRALVELAKHTLTTFK